MYSGTMGKTTVLYWNVDIISLFVSEIIFSVTLFQSQFTFSSRIRSHM